MFIKEKIRLLGAEAEREIAPHFAEIDEIARFNQEKVLDAFIKNRVAENCLYPTTGYGYGDIGRETLEQIYADIFGAEDALVRVTPDQVRFFIERFKSMDANDRDVQRQLIKTFIQEIYLYDDYMKILFSYDPSGERKIDFSEVEAEESSGASDSYSDTLAPLYGSCTNPFTITIFAYGFVLTVPV